MVTKIHIHILSFNRNSNKMKVLMESMMNDDVILEIALGVDAFSPKAVEVHAG